MRDKLLEQDNLEFGARIERHLARENGGDTWQRLAVLKVRCLRGNHSA